MPAPNRAVPGDDVSSHDVVGRVIKSDSGKAVAQGTVTRGIDTDEVSPNGVLSHRRSQDGEASESITGDDVSRPGRRSTDGILGCVDVDSISRIRQSRRPRGIRPDVVRLDEVVLRTGGDGDSTAMPRADAIAGKGVAVIVLPDDPRSVIPESPLPRAAVPAAFVPMRLSRSELLSPETKTPSFTLAEITLLATVLLDPAILRPAF